MDLVGYRFLCPNNVRLWDSDYGQTFRYNDNIAVMIEAPSTAGVRIDIESIGDAVVASEKYTVKSVEYLAPELLNFDSTIQNVSRSQRCNINNIEMLRIEGVFENTAQDTTVEYVGYYLLSDNCPVYIIGVPLVDGVSATELIDEIANSITEIP